MTRRRKLLVALGAGVLAAPLALFAQQKPARTVRVGYLDSASAEFAPYRLERLRAGLRDLGYVEGKSVVIEQRWAEGKYEQLPGLAAELLQKKVDLIVAAGTPAIGAAQKATTTLPIIMCASGDPVGSGFIKSLSRPGGNITGLSALAQDLSNKYLELLRVAIPKLSRVTVLVNPEHSLHPNVLKTLEAAAQATGVKVVPVQASTASQIDTVLGSMTQERPGALIVLPDGLFYLQARRIAELAAKHRLPTMFWTGEPVEFGGFMSYGQNVSEHFYRAATYVDKILKGAKPADLPVEQPTKIDLVINLKTAKAIGLKISQDLLFRADKVIE